MKPFITVKGKHFFQGEMPYYFLGANLWYGMNLASPGPGGDRPRLLRELDHLNALGVDNLRIMAGSEGPRYRALASGTQPPASAGNLCR